MPKSSKAPHPDDSFPRRLVICLPSDEARLLLPAATRSVHPWISGGLRTMHELAFAAAAAGWEVELRGWVDGGTFDAMADASGVAPELPPEPRPPTVQDVVAIPEGNDQALPYVGPWLSEAQIVLMVLAPLGMLGWPFSRQWVRPDPMRLTMDEVNRPEYFHALSSMGITVWSNAQRTAEAARAAGVPAISTGEGSPMPFPEVPADKPVDVTWLEKNRWGAAAARIAECIRGELAPIAQVNHEEMLRRLGQAKLLLYPGGIEGESRIVREARAMGAVPVVIAGGNPISTRLDEEHGVVSAPSEEAMPAVIAELLGDRPRLEALRRRGTDTARQETAWPDHVATVAQVLGTLRRGDGFSQARGVIGDELREHLRAIHEEARSARQLAFELKAHGDRLTDRAAELESEVLKTSERNQELEAELSLVRERKDACERELSELGQLRAVRWSRTAAGIVRRNR